jgi:hypothetical protein
VAFSNAPIFVALPKAWAVIVPATLDTSLTAPSNTATLLTAGSNGSKVDRIRLAQLITTATVTIVNLFLYDGSTYHLFDFFSIPSAVLSTTVEVIPTDKYYDDLVLATSWSLRCTVTTAAAQSAFKLTVLGGDF